MPLLLSMFQTTSVNVGKKVAVVGVIFFRRVQGPKTDFGAVVRSGGKGRRMSSFPCIVRRGKEAHARVRLHTLASRRSVSPVGLLMESVALSSLHPLPPKDECLCQHLLERCCVEEEPQLTAQRLAFQMTEESVQQFFRIVRKSLSEEESTQTVLVPVLSHMMDALPAELRPLFAEELGSCFQQSTLLQISEKKGRPKK